MSYYIILLQEPRQTEQLGLAMQDFYAKVDDPHGTGAIFFAVCRGKVMLFLLLLYADMLSFLIALMVRSVRD